MMKKDIFRGKIKEEYFSYILGYMIFFVLLFVGIGAFVIYVAIWKATTNSMGERILIAAFGVAFIILSIVFLVLELLVIRRFPKYEKLRRSLFNSDCYFTGSTSNEYFGGSRTIRGRRNKAAFNLVTLFAEAEKQMGKKRPLKYKIYSALVIVMCVLSVACYVIMAIMVENMTLLPEALQDETAICIVFVVLACVFTALAVFFLDKAFKEAIIAPIKKDKWRSDLYFALIDISVRQNNKKRKYWYDEDQLEQIEALVRSASEDIELKLETKGNRLISFTVIDKSNNREMFSGLFI